jgi:hypothetical protein
VSARGRLRGKVVAKVASCIAPRGGSACLSDLTNVPQGCTPTGCVHCGNGVVDPGEQCEPPGSAGCTATCQNAVCGNAVIEPGEDCDPPNYPECNGTCHFPRCGDGTVDPGEACEPPGSVGCTLTCERPICGNGVIEPGETCEPPGSLDCLGECTAGACDPPPMGETQLACLHQPFGSTVAIAAGAGGFLATWDAQDIARGEVMARRLDASALPTDAVPFRVSFDPVDSAYPVVTWTSFAPRVTGDATGWYVGWTSNGDSVVNAVRGTAVGSDATVHGLHTLAEAFSFGQCQSTVSGPIDVVTEAAGQFASRWMSPFGCIFGPIFYPHQAARVSFPAGVPSVVNVGTLDPPAYGDPFVNSEASAALAAGGGDTVAAIFVNVASGGMYTDNALLAHWVTGAASGTVTRIASALQHTRGPGLAWSGSSFLAAWTVIPGSGPTELRGVRFTSAGGSLDPDPGLLLATGLPAATAVTVSFDGTRWLVLVEADGNAGLDDLYGVHVATDGTPLDVAPVLLATDVFPYPPSLTSRPGGGFLVGFARPAGAGLLGVDLLQVP